MMLVVHNAHRMGVVTLFDELRLRFGTDYAGVGTLFSAYVFGYAIAQSLVGLVGDRYNAKRMLLTGLTLSTAFSLLFAGSDSYVVALGSRFLLGATGALLYTPAMKLGIVLFERKERGRVLGLLQAGAGIGSSGAMILVPFVASYLGLTGGFLSLPLLTAAVLLLAATLLPDVAVTQSTAQAAPAGPSLARRLDFWQLISISLFGMLAAYGLLTWLPTYLTSDYGYSEVTAGTLSSISNIALLVAAPIIGIVADLPRGRMGVLLGGSALAVVAFGLMSVSTNLVVVLGVAVLMGISLAATTAPVMLFAGERFGAGQTARAIGLTATAAQLGGTLAGTVFGAVLAYYGEFRAIWIACALLALVRLLLFLDLVRRDRRVASTRRLAGSTGSQGD